tara:strand:- start:1301 stop:1531 length:231 start_codon:yes stop_codon:yes gene_type:complete
MKSVIFESDVFLFETFYETKVSEDCERLEVDKTYIIGYHDETGEKILLNRPADATYIINRATHDDMHNAIDKSVES